MKALYYEIIFIILYLVSTINTVCDIILINVIVVGIFRCDLYDS